MTEILNIPAGVIQPKALLLWLRKHRDSSQEMANDCEPVDGYDHGRLEGYAAAFDMVMQHIQSDGAS